MNVLPAPVRDAMAASGATVTCLPVRLDGEAWETAVFFDVTGPECAGDHLVLSDPTRAVALGFEGDVVETGHGAVVVLRFEAHTVHDDPLAGEVLLAPGGASMHFEALKSLTRQARLGWFFAGDGDAILRAQAYPLGEEHHGAFEELLGDTVRHDALVRMTTGYDARSALAEVAARYAPDVGGGSRRGGEPS